jgi:uncharacterized protein
VSLRATASKRTTQDHAEAVDWYRQVAAMGDTTGMKNLGRCFQDGEGVLRDYAAAVYWYRKAVERGHAAAMATLGFLYSTGQDVKRDLAAAAQ